MSPTPRRKVTGARPTAIGAKATTPSRSSRATASRNGGAATRAGRTAQTFDWDRAITGMRASLAGHTEAHCQAERATGEGHTHGCVDFEDHSAGAHLCECGSIWRGR